MATVVTINGFKETIRHSPAEIAGLEVFHSVGCSQCHNGFLFIDHRFANNGLYEVYQDWLVFVDRTIARRGEIQSAEFAKC